MMKFSRKALSAGLMAAGLLFAAGGVQAAATIINTAGTVALGINNEGHLNTATGSVALNSSRTGVAFSMRGDSGPGFYDATSPGCFCEGWGVSVGAVSGYANVDSDFGSPTNLTVGSFVSGANSATSSVSLTSLPGLKVTQAYSEADNAPGALFKNVVTITNDTGGDLADLRYVRVMDWDVPNTEFDEFVTIKGTAGSSALEKSHLNGFASANPLDFSCDASGCGYGGVDVDFTDAGPADHGAYFRFNFGTLAAGATRTFTIFYGAAESEAAALAAIAAESIGLYSLGQCNDGASETTCGGPTAGTPATFIFGFKGEGITVVPEPASLALLGIGLAGLGAMRRRKQA